MTQEEILEYNKRCAEFLGMCDYYNENEYFEKGLYYCYPEEDKNPGCGYYTIIQNTNQGFVGIFNSDWNWIMEVVEAIENIQIKGQYIYSIQPRGATCEIKCSTQYSLAIDVQIPTIYEIAKSKKEAVVEAINQFLIWKNK